jgi:predicted dienelactone hydrolase
MDIDIWFPTNADVSTLEQATYGNNRARFAYQTDEVSTAQEFPLLVYSPGWGVEATRNSGFAESMASHGFVVAATTHIDSTVPRSAVDRPQDVSSIIDVMLAKSATEGDAFHNLIDGDSIGVAGHSIGGFAAMALVAGISAGGVTVPPDERVRAIMPIAKAIPSDPGLNVINVNVPTLLFAGSQDGASNTARSDLRKLSSSDKFAVIIDGADHPATGNSRCQQSPPETTCANDETMRLEALYGASFFNRYLREDQSLSHLFTQSYAVANEPLVEFWASAVADTDRDGRTTFADFLFLSEYYGATESLGKGRRADFNKDRRIDFADFLILSQNYSGGNGTAAAAVPEPATSSILLGGVVIVLGLRRRSPIRTTQHRAAHV